MGYYGLKTIVLDCIHKSQEGLKYSLRGKSSDKLQELFPKYKHFIIIGVLGIRILTHTGKKVLVLSGKAHKGDSMKSNTCF